MSDFLYSIDLTIFYFINHTISLPILDKFFSMITSVNNWYIAYVILLGISWKMGGLRGKIAVLGVILLIIVSDQTGYRLIKELFARPRPCDVLTDVITPIGCTGTYSFPSNHALNNFAAAVFFYRLFPKLKWVLFITASLIAISRVYLGLHYPSDIIGGALIGILLGYIFSQIALLTEKKFLTMKAEKSQVKK
ncbi:MAG: phosphatase PAP2 family protein [Ignavibacterium sp.]|uniref:Phosphatase PAP2 family protein n=1 Tax=Ignavibacterium album TaxID=591197 RepID=A0A7V3E837_9BACT|nr:phosphatase PAP2 family protein [Ignavibacterium album]MCA2004402.1 phosphatase PAP2 family protein [Ignavibacterium sp.]MCX8105494.1 phosphatase PAP2 family protein [Ignavibacterium album]